MVLGVREIILTQRVRVEPHVGVTAEHEHCLFGVERAERRGVAFVTGVGKVGQGVREMHEGLEPALPQILDRVYELLAVVQQAGQREVA